MQRKLHRKPQHNLRDFRIHGAGNHQRKIVRQISRRLVFGRRFVRTDARVHAVQHEIQRKQKIRRSHQRINSQQIQLQSRTHSHHKRKLLESNEKYDRI